MDLDEPILRSLETLHQRFALAAGPARRFIPEIGPLAGYAGAGSEALRALEAVTSPGDGVSVFSDEPVAAPPGWEKTLQRDLLQMARENGAPPAEPAGSWQDLQAADAPEMLELARLTKPGPFASRTRELGRFVGVREGGRLAAMAGERLRLPGWTEISAVCTHPRHLGRGHAGRLMTVLLRGVAERGERAFLHVLPENARAIAVYERLGFSRRRSFTYAAFRRGAGAS